jgi:hypothetical protein
VAGSYYLTKECIKSAGGGNFTTCVAVFDDPDVPYTLIEYLVKLVNWAWHWVYFASIIEFLNFSRNHYEDITIILYYFSCYPNFINVHNTK